MAVELKVNDMDIASLSDDIKKWLENQDLAFEKYIYAVNYVATQAIMSGRVHNAFVYLHENAEKIYSNSIEQGKVVKNNCKSFMSQIDDIDMELYG